MSSLDLLLATHRELARLVDAGAYREARRWLEARDEDDALDVFDDRAAARWLWEAEEACRAGDRDRMHACLVEAARFHRPENAHRFRETRRTIRQIALEPVLAPHWFALLRVASDTRRRLVRGDPPPPGMSAFAHPRLVARVGIRCLDALEHEDVEPLASRVLATYPGELRHYAPSLGAPFLRSALRLAGGRPDLAALDLVELPGTNPLVSLDRARVAYALGVLDTAAQALADLVVQHGHVVVRRLHTGVLLAQIADARGDTDRAVEILRALPRSRIGRRPVLWLAELLDRSGRGGEAREVLRAWLEEHPDDAEARARLGDG